MGKYKKEHIYSKDKKIKVINQNREDGTFSCVDELQLYLFGLDNTLWGRFIIDVINNKKQLKIPKYENFKYIINEIEKDTTKNVISKKIFDLENYNPFVDMFPIETLPINYQKLIIKKQKFIKEYCKFNEKYNYNGLNICCRYNNQEINIKLALNKYDILILFNSHSTFIFAKKHIDLNNLFNFLDKNEPNKWILEKNNKIYLKKGCKTQYFVPNNYKLLIKKTSEC